MGVWIGAESGATNLDRDRPKRKTLRNLRDSSEPSRTGRSVAFHLPHLPDIDAFVADARVIIESGRLSEGPFVRRLEDALRPWLADRDVVAVSNCSDGLIAALSLLTERGKEVIIPGFTYLATWQAVIWAGMIPVVADVDDRGLLDPAAVEAAITSRTGAIVAVHLAGTLAPMATLRSIADKHEIGLVADAAHAVGARSGGISAGSLGDIEVFSIGATKQLAAGEGGCLTVRDRSRVADVRRWALQGHEPGSIDATGNGMNLRLSELTAALALHQLGSLAEQLDRRQSVHERYVDAMTDLPVRLSGPLPNERSAHKDQLIWVDDPTDRGPLRRHLEQASIETKPYYDIAVPDLTAFSGRVASADRSRALAARSFAIPIHARLGDADVDRVADCIVQFYRGERAA
jgi:dTDP-4-amino-4,6-dideoxygalactose transaminase